MTKPWVLHLEKQITPKEWFRLDRFLKDQAEVAAKRRTRRAIRVRAIVSAAAYAGLRRAEVAALNCGDLQLRNDDPFIIVRRGKGGKLREIVISPVLRRLLKDYLRHKEEWGEDCLNSAPVFVSQRGRYSGAGIWRVFREACRRAGIRVLNVHVLRHFFASVLYKAKRDLRLVQKQLGHSRLVTTETYAHLDTATANEGMAAFDRLIAAAGR